ncbi:nucleoside-diphosphate-sugar epimerase [Acidovorax sp. CF316]|uniref:NAD-dependent epimerase/dehydratase family protein n=1 Tax=Acidovorax sp. CF316 TaxID=1144317 RepID=UPI00026BDB97|nr:NAD-dependent epimerase/dehydratase family protein [Acidovorax sp. CF316]EJE51600.1 nucleoside-diphosphate-sugar epimerase [Acidovorax sp. CF316]
MQKVLLLGGSVFVGRALLQRLIAQGFDVTAVTRGLVQSDWGAAHHIACDRRDAHQLASRLRGHTFDAVVDASCYGPEDCRALLAGLHAMPTTYVLLSSAAVYERSTAPLPFSEASPAHGDGIWGTYGRDKAAAETVLCASSIPRQFVVRPPYIYGPGNNLDRERFVWARQLAQAPIFVPADGETLIQFVGIDDLTRAIVGFLDPQCAVAPGIYNLASPTYVSFNQYIALLGQIAGRQSHVVHVSDSTIPAREYFPFRKAHLILSTQKLATWSERPQTPLVEGLQAAFDWISSASHFTVEPSQREVDLRRLCAPGA